MSCRREPAVPRAALGSAGGQASSPGVVAVLDVVQRFRALAGAADAPDPRALRRQVDGSPGACPAPSRAQEWDGADVVVVGSKGGTDTHPAWFHNLMAMSETEVEVGGQRRRVRPRLANAEERARLWPRLVELYPPYEEYQSFTSREIPVVSLKPAG